MQIYGVIIDNGDGSASVSWFTDKVKVDQLLSDDYKYPEIVNLNEGGPIVLSLPDDFDLETAGFLYLNETY